MTAPANSIVVPLDGSKTAEEAVGKNCLELGYEPWHAEMHDREIDEVIAGGAWHSVDVPDAG